MRVRFSDPGFEFGEERGRERLEAKSRSLTVSSLSQRGPLDEFVEGGFSGGRRRGVAEGEIGVASDRSRVDGERKSLPLQRLRRDLVREGSERRKESTGVELLLFLGEHRPNVLASTSTSIMSMGTPPIPSSSRMAARNAALQDSSSSTSRRGS